MYFYLQFKKVQVEHDSFSTFRSLRFLQNCSFYICSQDTDAFIDDFYLSKAEHCVNSETVLYGGKHQR